MDNSPEPAKKQFQIKIFPAGRNDRVVEISDSSGHPLKYVHCRRRLGGSREEYLDRIILNDWENDTADDFAHKYLGMET